MVNYGRANRYEFDNPQKWVTQPAVPLLDEHIMSNDDGRPIATVDRRALEQIAENNNRRVRETGDPATLILGHTSDDPRAPEKPAKGFVVNYRVLPYKRDPRTGQVIYAIHGDFKVRPKNAAILEEYPRRSVELWWHKKELDPIALLGGTSPERDLSVVVRNARLNHVALDQFPHPSPGTRGVQPQYPPEVRMYSRGAATVEAYEIDHQQYGREDKFGKVMKEFAEGKLHSGSKKGPKVTSRKQAQAIAASEAGVSRHSREDTDMAGRNGHPRRYEHLRTGDDDSPGCHKYEEEGEPLQYDDASLDTYDGGQDGDASSDFDDVDDGSNNDPTVEKFLQSKAWKGLTAKVDMILQAITGEGMGEGGPGGGMEGAPPEELPPPGPGGPEAGLEGPGGDGMEPGGPMPGGEAEVPPGPDEEETRRAHGNNPVQFSEGTNMAGPRSSFIPTVGKRYARPGHPQKKGTQNPEFVRMSRELNALKLENATNIATNAITQLEREGVIFGDTLAEATAAKDEQIQYCAYLYMRSKDDFNHEIEVMRKRYRRSRPNPASPVSVGTARYARDAQGQPPADEEYEPQNPREASDFADCLTLRNMPRAEAIKFMRSKRSHYAQYDHEALPGGDGFNSGM